MALRVFMMYLAVVWTPYGMFCFFAPEVLESYAGLAAQNATATTELRAMYGGLQIAIGASALLAFFNGAYMQRALFLQLVLAGGLALSRSLAALLGGDASGYTLGALGFEWSTLLLCLWFIRKPA